MKPFIAPYIIANSGARVGPGEQPTLKAGDIIHGLSRVQRFGGQGRELWTVIQHSLVVAHIAMRMLPVNAVNLHALLHDAHEAFTGDIPSPFKTPTMKKLQTRLDRHIRLALRVIEPTPQAIGIVKNADLRALVAEAAVVGPPCLSSTAIIQQHFGVGPLFEDVDTVRMVLRQSLPSAIDTFRNELADLGVSDE